MCVLAKTELRQNLVHHILVIQKAVIGILSLHVSLRLFQKISLKGGHLVFSEQRGLRTPPNPPENVSSLLLFRLIHRKECLADIFFQLVVQRLSGIFSPVHIDLLELSVFVQRKTTMVQQVIIVDLIQISLIQEKAHVRLQTLALQEC